MFKGCIKVAYMSLEQKVKYNKKIKDAARAGLKVFSIRDDEFPYSRIGVEETEILQSDESCVDYLNLLNLKLINVQFANDILGTVDIKRKLARTLFKISEYYCGLFNDSDELQRDEDFANLRLFAKPYLDGCMRVYSEILGMEKITPNPDDCYMLGLASASLSTMEFSKERTELLIDAELCANTAIKSDKFARPKYYDLLRLVHQYMLDSQNQSYSYNDKIKLFESNLETIEMTMNLRKRFSDKFIYANTLLDYSNFTHDNNKRFKLKNEAINNLQMYYHKTYDSNALMMLQSLLG